MDIDEAIRAFSTAGHHLPVEAMRWARDHWKEAAPRFLALLESYADGPERSQEDADALFFILHLAGEMKETRAFPAICRLGIEATIEEVLGDGVMDSLTRIMVSTFDGDLGRLRRLIEEPKADEFARTVGLEVLAYATVAGILPREEAESYLRDLFDKLEPRFRNDSVWGHWAIVIAILGFEQLTPLVEAAFREEYIDPTYMKLRNYHRIAQESGQRDGWASLKAERIEPLTDAVAELSSWYCFSPQYEEALRKREAGSEGPDTRLPGGDWGGPVRNPYRYVGRNDPCPCGSGKKYKKCCLAAEAA